MHGLRRQLGGGDIAAQPRDVRKSSRAARPDGGFRNDFHARGEHGQRLLLGARPLAQH